MMADINNLVVENNSSVTEEKDEWSIEERHMLESQIILADNPRLCLDPDNTICESQLRLNQSRNMWNMHKFQRIARKFSQVTVNRKRKLDQFTHRPGSEIYDYITRVRTKQKSPNASHKWKRAELKPIPVPNLDSPAIGPPSQGENKSFVKNHRAIHSVARFVLMTVMMFVNNIEIINCKSPF